MGVSYFGGHGHVPLRVSLLHGAVGASCSPRWRAARGSCRCARTHRRADPRAVKTGAKDSSKARR